MGELHILTLKFYNINKSNDLDLYCHSAIKSKVSTSMYEVTPMSQTKVESKIETFFINYRS